MGAYDSISDQEILAIMSGSDGRRPEQYNWTCQLSTPAGVMDVSKIVSVYWMRDYIASYAAEMRIDVLVMPGRFESMVASNPDHIDVVLTKTPLNTSTNNSLPTPLLTKKVYRYKGVLEDGRSETMEGNRQVASNNDLLDSTDLRMVSITLVEKSNEQMRTIETGGNFRHPDSSSIRAHEVLKFLYAELTSRLDVDNDHAVTGVDVVDNASLAAPVSQITIAHGTLLKDLPYYLQNRVGVYTTGIGRHFQNGVWYIYPLYDSTRFSRATRKLTVLNIPNNLYSGSKKLSKFLDGHLFVLSTGMSVSKNNVVVRQLNQGNGVRYMRSSHLMGKMIKSGNGKAVASRKDTMVEYLAKSTGSGVNYAPMIPDVVCSSDAYVSSTQAMLNGAFLQISWEASEPDLLTPGMPVRLLSRAAAGTLKETFGTVIATENNVMTDSSTITSSSHTCYTAITLFVASQDIVSAINANPN